MATATERSPMQEYEEKLHILWAIRDSLSERANPIELEMLNEAIAAWIYRHENFAASQERRFRTRFYCAVCYGEIPAMQEVRLRGNGYAHKVCEHLYRFDMAALRKQIKAQRFDHDPVNDWHYKGDPCIVLTEGWPTMHPKRTTFEEKR